MPTTVFISSTSRDLLEHRTVLAKALLDAGFHPVDMANFMARPEGAVIACLTEVAEADLFVGVYAWRYGFVPPEAELSITEQEFVEARRLDKPCFCFVIEENYPWPEEYIEKGIAARLLRDFKDRLDATLVRTTFTTPQDLATKVLASLQRWERKSKESQKKDPLTGNTFVMTGDIKAGALTQGGTQNIGEMTVDLSENKTETHVAEGATYLSGQGHTIGDSFSGSFQGANIKSGDQLSGHFQGNLNIRSQLQHVTQILGAELAEKDKLVSLVNQLQEALSQIPPERTVEAEKVNRRMETLLEELNDQAPDTEAITLTGNLLKKADQNLSEVMQAVLTLSAQIVAHVLKLAS